MDSTRVRTILKSLADGLDPATGAPFQPDSPYQQAESVRALHSDPRSSNTELLILGEVRHNMLHVKVQHPTSKLGVARPFKVGRWTLDVGRSLVSRLAASGRRPAAELT